MTVIALDGLNVRSRPDVQAETIGGLSFLEAVEVINCSCEMDTVGDRTYYGLGYGGPYTALIAGPWCEIKHGKTIGFVHGSYLSCHPLTRKEVLPGVNEHYGLNFIEGNCYDNVQRNPSLNWYGLYQKDEGVYELRSMTISYFYDYTDLGVLYVLGGEKGLILLFGMEGKARRALIDGQHFDWPEGKMYSYTEQKGTLLTRAHRLHLEGRPPVVTLEKDGIRQILSPQIADLSDASQLMWVGDLDGDGQEDYIIKYGEKSVAIILYLSSEAEEDTLVKPVAVYYSGYCC
ncbi:MAG: SH3 domain-containing protein [Saprospiraceae bacterium]|nr:SH3 domain-containing protein [Lewinella sp.]